MCLSGLFIKKKSPHHEMPIPQIVDTADISEEKRKRDLQKLDAFNKKIGVKNAEPEVKAGPEKVQEKALKLKNPFRGV